MDDKVKLYLQKRKSLKSQITSLTNLIDRGQYDKDALKLRMTRVTELYHAYEDFHDELVLLDPSDQHNEEFTSIQERFYSLAGKVERLTSNDTSSAVPGHSRDAIPSNDASHASTTRRVKLPEASLPTFDGRFENWLSFKNTFIAMIDTRADLSDVEKLQYLRSALKGEAANKVKILAIEGSNYSKAWDLLKRAYEVKRILISRHISSLINLPIVERETTDGLSKLADESQQHVASLNALGVEIGSEILVNLLESKLPKNTADKWEETLTRDEFPMIDDLYEFIYKTAVRVSKRARADTNKRDDDRNAPSAKRGRMSNKIFLLNVAKSCVVCKNGSHPLFRCERFKQLNIPKRIEIVKAAKLCYNCLRSHKGKACNYTNCTKCQRRHNTLLHLDGHPVAQPVTSDTTKKEEKPA